MLAGVAGVPPLVPVYFQHFAQLLLHLLHVLLLQSEHYLHEPTIRQPFHDDPESYRTSFPSIAMEQQG